MQTWSLSNTGYTCLDCMYTNFNPLLYHLRKIVDGEGAHPKGHYICNKCDSKHTKVILVRV